MTVIRLQILRGFLNWAHVLSGDRYDFRKDAKELLYKAVTADTPIAAFDDLPEDLREEVCRRWADYSQGGEDMYREWESQTATAP